MTRFLPLITAVTLLACTPQSERRDTVPTPESGMAAAASGTVSIVGSAPMNVQVILRGEDGRAVRIVGPLEPEVRRLSGAEVAVFGQVSSNPDPIVGLQIQATDFEVLSVDGEPALMGEIVSMDGERAQMRMRDGETVTLTGAPREFRVGQKVWIQGPRSFAVQSYGVIRP
jgi:hypothetical protein